MKFSVPVPTLEVLDAKNCPFCCKEDLKLKQVSWGATPQESRHQVICNSCGASGPITTGISGGSSERAAIIAWNSRHTS